MRFSNVLAGALALGTVLGAAEAGASYPVGVWVKVKKVVLEPNATAPTKIQIHGAAMLYDKSTNTTYLGYSEPAFGFLYYACPSGQDKTCVSEWADVEKNIAATDDVCIGLGDQTLPTGTLRAPNATPVNPDDYPISIGVVGGFSPCQVIEKFLGSQPDGGSGGAGGSAGASSGGAAGSAGAGGASSGGASSGGASSGGASSGGASSGGATASGGASSGGATASGGNSGGGDDSDDDGGCTVSSASSAPFAWLLGALGAALAFALRRRS